MAFIASKRSFFSFARFIFASTTTTPRSFGEHRVTSTPIFFSAAVTSTGGLGILRSIAVELGFHINRPALRDILQEGASFQLRMHRGDFIAEDRQASESVVIISSVNTPPFPA